MKSYTTSFPLTQLNALACLAQLSDYASQNHSTSIESVTLFFLVGSHTLEDHGVAVQNIASVTMMGDPTDLPELRSIITCSSRSGSVVGFDFHSVTDRAQLCTMAISEMMVM